MPHSVFGSTSQHLSQPRRPERSLAIAVLGAVLFLKPFLGIFDRGGTTMVWGVPLLYAYLFAAWVLIVVLTAVVMENRSERAARGSGVNRPYPTGATGESGSDEYPTRSETV